MYACPVAGRIVVGVDGSEAAVAALRFAVEEAKLRDATLVAVFAWTFVPPAAVGEPGVIPVAATTLMDDLDAERTGAERMLDRGARRERHLGDVTVERVVSEGSAGRRPRGRGCGRRPRRRRIARPWRHQERAARVGLESRRTPRALPGRDRARAVVRRDTSRPAPCAGFRAEPDNKQGMRRALVGIGLLALLGLPGAGRRRGARVVPARRRARGRAAARGGVRAGAPQPPQGPDGARAQGRDRTALPAGVPVRRLEVRRRVVTVDLGRARGRAGARRGASPARAPARAHARRRPGRARRPRCASRAASRSASSPASTCVAPCHGALASRRARALAACTGAAARRPRLPGHAGRAGRPRRSGSASACSASRSGPGSRATACSPPEDAARPEAGRAARARDPRRPGQAHRGAPRPPGGTADRARPRAARRAHLHRGVGDVDPGGLVPRVPQGALLVVGAVQGLDAVGELLHRRHRLPRVLVRARRTRRRTAVCA